MSDVRTFTLDTNKMFSELETASEKKCQSLFIFRKLEKTEKVLLSKIKGALKLQHNDKVSQAELTDEAYRHVRYAEWLKEYQAGGLQKENIKNLSKPYIYSEIM